MNDYPEPVAGLLLVALALLAVCAGLSWTFVVMYSRLQWQRSAEGRHLMRFTGILAVTFTLSLFFNLLPIPLLWNAAISVVVFGAIAGELWARITLLRRAQRNRDNRG